MDNYILIFVLVFNIISFVLINLRVSYFQKNNVITEKEKTWIFDAIDKLDYKRSQFDDFMKLIEEERNNHPKE